MTTRDAPPPIGEDGRAYLDHAATTPMADEALEAMLPFLGATFGNPSGSHHESRLARRAVDDAREQIAALLGADLGEVVFTSGGTESDNLAILGAAPATGVTRPPVLVCSAMEHHAVLNPMRALAERSGAPLREIATGKDGIIDLDGLAEACTPDVGLVSVMTVNNETGSVQPIAEVASLVRGRSPSAVFHTDAVQAVAWLDVAGSTALADLVTVSAHKFGGPKGIGALVARNGVGLRAMMLGGGQERERRSGTQNVAGIVGMAAALTAASATRTATVARVSALRDRLGDGLLAGVPGAVETGDRRHRVAGHLHLRFAGVESEAMVVLLDEAGVAVSAGAACSSGAIEASHVLASMGFGPDEASSGIRFSLGPTTTGSDVDLALAAVPGVVAQLRD
jgi:cysteine desulfurase